MNEHERELRSVLGRVQSRWLASELASALARATLAVAVSVLAAFGLIRLLELSGGPLLALTGLVLVTSLVLTVVQLWPLRVAPTAARLARFVEERCPEFDDHIVSAVEAIERPTPSIFQPVLVAEASARLAELDLDRIVSHAVIRRRVVALAASLALLAGALYVARTPVRLAALTAYYRVFPPTMTLEVVPGDASVRAGEGLDIVAVVNGVTPGWSLGEAIVRVGRGDDAQALEMTGEGARFSARVPRVTEDFDYRVTVGDLTSTRFHVRALTPPRVARIDVSYAYPPYSGLAPRVEEDGGDIYAPEGTRVRLRITPDAPVVNARLVSAKGAPRGLRPTGDGAYEADMVVDEDGSYRIALADADGLSNPGDTEYFIRIMDDRPPDVRIVRPAGDRQVTRLEEVAIEARADDDYGIDRLELVYAVRGGLERVVPLHQGPPSASVTVGQTLFVESFDVRPGDFVTYYARARDIGRGKKPTTAQSDIFFLEVRPFNEEFVAAQSQAMAGAGGGQFDDLAGAQKDIIVATWKIERRALAGRSAEDIKSIARAQAELKDKAAQLASQFATPRPPSRRREGQPPAPVTEDEVGSPMRAAVEAMEKAEQSLAALQTKNALPHEMEALNHLLKAQAENERRQVSQQRGNGGNGGGERSNQDLSALFDRELLRQTETNYETQDSSEPQQPNQGDDALSKLRELAKRQDELARRQRELARRQADVAEEEMKRQLERLTRDQEELRREAEQLAEQLTRRRQGQEASNQSAKGQQGSESQGQSSEGSQVRSASEEMRGSMGEMRQSDVQQAAERGAKAAERLRDAERQLAGPQPDEQRRKLGDLQLETQQLAEAQRQVASQTARMGRDERDEDLLRRLAGEEARLAERVDELQRGLGSLRRSGGGREQAGVGAASEELSRQKIGDRMRQAAEELRNAAGSTSGAGTRQGTQGSKGGQEQMASEQRAMAGALDKVAERMGAALGQDIESRKVAEQVARLRELRDRLSALEQRIDDLSREGEPSAQQSTDRSAKPGSAKAGEPRGSGRDTPSTASNESESSPGAEQRQASNQGSEGAQGNRGGSGGSGELQRLQSEYARELKQTEQLMGELQRENPASAQGLASLEQHYYSTSAPGTEAFKQDFAMWDVLRKDVRSAIDRLEASLSDKLAERLVKDRVNGGADERIPESYRKLISEYYRSLARKPAGKS